MHSACCKSTGTLRDEEQLHAEIARVAMGCIVEIGVLGGHTTRIFLANTSIPVYGIDPIVPDSMNPKLVGNANVLLSMQSEYSNFTFIQKYSQDVCLLDIPNGIGYLFIDGNHEQAAVRLDVKRWAPRILRGGYLELHDSAANRGGPHNWPGPSVVADELIKDSADFECIRTVFSTTLFRRK